MGIIAWFAVGLAVGLLVNMLLPGKRSRALIFSCLTCFTGVLAAARPATCSPGNPGRPAGSRAAGTSKKDHIGPARCGDWSWHGRDAMASDPEPIASPVDPCDSGVT
jgi:hypothetical protein